MPHKTIELHRGERIVAVVPDLCSGPGWSNAPVWVHVATIDGRLRTECLQPDEQTPEMHTLFTPGATMCEALVGAVPTRPAIR